MPSRAQLESALRNADAAGDVEAARALAIALRDGAFEQEVDTEQKPQGLMDSINTAITDNPIGRVVSEGAAAVNRGAAQVADFVTTTPVNAALELAGSDRRIPSIEGLLAPATQGNFMQEGLARDVVRSAGEAVPASLAVGGVLRSAAQALPAATASEGAGSMLLRGAGQGSAQADAGFGAISASGGELGQEVGGDAGALVGAIAAPLSASAALSAGIQGTKAVIRDAAETSLTREAAPTISTLKETARGVYKEIDDLGAVVDSSRVDGLIRDIGSTIKNEGFNKRIHPKVSAAFDEIATAEGKNQKVTDLDILRKVARSAAASIEPDESRIGSMMVNKIDDFMDNIDESALVGGEAGNVGEKYRQARQLWQRAKKAEDIDLIFDKAKNQASGFENGLRTQFRALLNNKKKIKSYTAEEKAAIEKVVRGGGVENAAKALGKLGFSEGQASSMLLGSLGVAGGAAIGGGVGAVAVPLVGQVSKNLAQKLTRNNAEMVSQIVRSGKNSDAIVKAYIKSVPASERNAYELSELLIKTGSNTAPAPVFKSEKMKSFMSDVGYLVGAAKSQNQEEENDQ